MPRSSWHISFPRKDVVPLVTTTVHVPSSSSSTQTDTIAVLLGFYSELEAAKHLIHLNVVDGPTTLAEIHSIWEQTSKQVARAQRRSYSQPHIDSLPAQWQYYEQNLKKQPKFQCCLPRREYHIRKVPIQSLITPQWFVNRDHVEHCKQQAPEPEPSDWDSILNFIFPAESPLPSPKQNQASLLFPPDIQNLHITLSPCSTRGSPGICQHLARPRRSKLPAGCQNWGTLSARQWRSQDVRAVATWLEEDSLLTFRGTKPP